MQRSDKLVAVIGGGAAGIQAALAAADHSRVTLITDGPLGRSNSVMAQGGLHVPFESAESHESMVADIERSARVPLDRSRIERFVAEILPTIRSLESWGLELDRDDEGGWRRRWAGGMSEPRIVSCGDALGRSLIQVLKRRLESSSVEVLTQRRVIDLEGDGGGVSVVSSTTDGERSTLHADAVIVATGGASFEVARRRGEACTNPPNTNRHLSSVVEALGVPGAGPDEYQYQPFGLIEVDRIPARCVPETVIGMGARLVDVDGALVVEALEDRLAIRAGIEDAIANGRAIATANGPGVRLTLDEVDPERMAAAFPKLLRVMSSHGLALNRVLVRPVLHYQLGGLATDATGATSVEGVFATGEAVGGLHGKNRLMGTGITDSLVNGRLVGAAAARAVTR